MSTELVVSSSSRRRGWRRFALPAVALVLVGVFAATRLLPDNPSSAQAEVGYLNESVTRRDLALTLSGTGSLKPANSYTVTSLISGEILQAPFEEGDVVEKGGLLYQFDSVDAASSIEQAQISLAQSQRNHSKNLESLEDLQVKADKSGEVLELLVEEGDTVNQGQTLATLRDSATMCLTIPFGSDDVSGFSLGQSAEVTLDGSFETLTGTITEIAGVEQRLEGNRLVREITVELANPGGIAPGQAATALVGNVACNGSGTFSYRSEQTLSAAVSGEVASLHVREGERVSPDQVLMTLTSDSLSDNIANSADSLRNSELSLQTRMEQLEDYAITSPISGTIIEKNYKQGDMLENGSSLCTIFDLSYLTMTLNVDELDIAGVQVGQAVTVTAEALPNQQYQGVVTKININGTTQSGVTSYPVTIRIDSTEGLLPGMNVQAKIVVDQRENVLTIPVSALMRGDQVLVQSDGTAQTPSSMPSDATPSQASGGTTDNAGGPDIGATAGSALPDGFVSRQVTVGISDGDHIEIISGLSEGDVIAYLEAGIPESSGNMFVIGPGGGPGEAGGPQGGGRMGG